MIGHLFIYMVSPWVYDPSPKHHNRYQAGVDIET